MSSWIKLPIEEVDQKFLKDLKKHHAPGAQVEFRIVDQSELTILPEATFWGIIDRLDWAKDDVREILERAIQALSDKNTAEIFLFEDMLAAKLRALDTPAHALAIYGVEDKISVDGFLYIRAGVVAEGRDYYENILAEPSKLTDDLDFEPLLSLAALAYKRKTGKDFAYLSHISYETFTNASAWSK